MLSTYHKNIPSPSPQRFHFCFKNLITTLSPCAACAKGNRSWMLLSGNCEVSRLQVIMHQCFCSSSHVFFKIHTGECSFYLLRFLVNMSHILLTQMGLPHFLWSGNFPNSVSMLTFSEVSRFQALHELNTSFLLFSFTYASHQQRACQTKAGPQFSPNKLVAMIPYYHINISACASLLCQQLESIFKCFVRSKNPWYIRKYFERFLPL